MTRDSNVPFVFVAAIAVATGILGQEAGTCRGPAAPWLACTYGGGGTQYKRAPLSPQMAGRRAIATANLRVGKSPLRWSKKYCYCAYNQAALNANTVYRVQLNDALGSDSESQTMRISLRCQAPFKSGRSAHVGLGALPRGCSLPHSRHPAPASMAALCVW